MKKINFNNKTVFILIATIKIVFLVIFLLSKDIKDINSIPIFVGDSGSYIDPVEHLMSSGNYVSYNSYGTAVYAGRMPYYGFIYLLFRVLFSKSISLLLMVLLQIILDLMACFILFKIIKKFVFLGNWLNFIVVCILGSGLYLSSFAFSITPENISYSLLVFFLYYYLNYLRDRKIKTLFYFSIFLNLSIVLKPYYGLFLVLIAAEMLMHYVKEKKFKTKIFSLVKEQIILVSTLLILLSPWTIRNYNKLNAFVPLQQNMQAGYYYDETTQAFRDFVASWGGSYMYWDKRSAGCYFTVMINLPCDFIMPEYAYCNCYGKKELDELRQMYFRHQINVGNRIIDETLKKSVSKRFNDYTNCFKNEKPFFYYVISPLLRIKNTFIHSGSFYYEINHDKGFFYYFFLLTKIVQSLIYYLVLIFGILGMFAFTKKHSESWIFIIFPLTLVLFFPIYLTWCEWRYLNPFYLFFTVSMCFFISLFFKNKSNSEINSK